MGKRRLRLKKSIVNKFIVLILIIILLILFLATLFIYNNFKKIDYYHNINDYSYIVINKMSKAFAKIDNKNLHFANDNKKTYIVAISKKDSKKYKKLINYTYELEDNAKSVKAYVYPIKINKEIKKISLKNINKFLLDDKIKINNKNFNKYLGNYYLDTTIKTHYKFNYIVFILFFIVMILLLIIINFIIRNKLEKV